MESMFFNLHLKSPKLMKLFRAKINTGGLSFLLLIIRLGVCGLMLTHGYPKLMKLLEGGEIQFGDPPGLGPAVSLALTVFAEFVCSILIGLGLATRLASIPLIITMCVAVFIVHGSDPIGKQELGSLYLMIYLVLLTAGPGRISLDSLIKT
jgi:putative oxidoreductase